MRAFAASSLPLLALGLLVTALDAGWAVGILTGARIPSVEEAIVALSLHVTLIAMAVAHEAARADRGLLEPFETASALVTRT